MDSETRMQGDLLSHKQQCGQAVMLYGERSLTTCSWNNIPINQSDLRDKFTVYVKFSLTTRVISHVLLRIGCRLLMFIYKYIFFLLLLF